MPRGREFPHQTDGVGVFPGGWSGLELTDSITCTWGGEGGTSGQYMNIDVDENVLVLEVIHSQGIIMQIPSIK